MIQTFPRKICQAPKRDGNNRGSAREERETEKQRLRDLERETDAGKRKQSHKERERERGFSNLFFVLLSLIECCVEPGELSSGVVFVCQHTCIGVVVVVEVGVERNQTQTVLDKHLQHEE
jgi:hypothetical protein